MSGREATDVNRAFRIAVVLAVVAAAANFIGRWRVDDFKTDLYGALGVLAFVIVFGFLVINAVFSVQRRIIRRRTRWRG